MANMRAGTNADRVLFDLTGVLVMTKHAMLGAALLTAAFVTPAAAQAVVEDPDYCAPFYPNANCQNYGPGNPLYPGYYSNSYAGAYAPAPGAVAVPVRPHRRHHR
jgi:hypothetical protein